MPVVFNPKLADYDQLDQAGHRPIGYLYDLPVYSRLFSKLIAAMESENMSVIQVNREIMLNNLA